MFVAHFIVRYAAKFELTKIVRPFQIIVSAKSGIAINILLLFIQF